MFTKPTYGAGSGNGGGESMEARIAKLESDVKHIQSDITEMKPDIRETLTSVHRLNPAVSTIDTNTKALCALAILLITALGYGYVHLDDKITEANKNISAIDSSIKEGISSISAQITELKIQNEKSERSHK